MSAFSLAMPQSDPKLPLSAPDPQPQRFIDKYRPSRLADVVGQGAVVFELAEFVANPYPSAWFLSGPTGTGKSSVARCVAAEIGAVEFGGLYTINSGTQDADCVLETLKDCTRAPMMVRGASGWRCIIVEECDHISPKAKQIWLSGLDDLPPKTVVIFTTNYPEKLDERFLTRGKHLQFESRADVIMQDVQTLCDHIADREGIPRVDCRNLPNIADKSGAISFRRVADAMQSATLKHRVMARLESSPLATSPSPAPVVPPPVVPPPVVPPPVIPAEVSPPVETSPVAEVAAPRRKRTGTGKRRMSALETAESALAAGNPSAESGPIRAIQEIANPDHVWIRAEGSGKRTWRLHTPSPAGFIPTDRTMDASDAIACVLAHASHKPIPVPPLADSAEVAAVPPVAPVSTPPARIRPDVEPIALDAMRNVMAVSLSDPSHIRIRHGMRWVLHVRDAEGTYWRQSDDSVGIVAISRGIRDGSIHPCPVPVVIGFRPDPSPSAPVEILPSAEVASGSQSDYAIMSVTVYSAGSPIVQHATSEFRDGVPCMLMTSAGRMSDADRIACRERDRVWRRALSPLANRIRKPRPVPPPPSDPVPPPPPREFSGLTIGVKGHAYGLSVIPGGFRLESPKGDVYDVVTSTDEATSNHGYHCDCPSHRNTHAGVGTKGCKHVLALREVGLIPPIVPPVPPPPPSDPGPDGPPSPGPEFSESIDTVFAGDLPYLIREHTDMSGNRILSAWMRDNGDGRHTMTYTDAEGNRWGAMNSRLMHPRDVQAMQDASEFEQLQTAKDWRESQLEWCYATIEWARPDAIGGRRNYGTITIGPLAPPDPDRPRGIFDGIDGSIVLPPARSARPIPSDSQHSGRRHTFGRVTLDRESGLIRIQFDSKPIAYERRLLREDGWRWDNGGECWVKPYSEAAEDFAARYL